jgi:hypothetical protein
MTEPTKIIPFLRAALAKATDADVPQFEGYPRFALEFGRPVVQTRSIVGFGIPGGMRDERTRR